MGCTLALVACDKHDPILPGTRTAVFDSTDVKVTNKTITTIPITEFTHDNTNCPYTQDNTNVIRNGDKKIFTGFPTKNTVTAQRQPICDGKYIYAGLTTGEVVKINPNNRNIAWIADIFRASNMTGGTPTVDIVTPIVPMKNSVFAGGLGDAFCKLNATSGVKQWCANIGVGVPFTVTEKHTFVVTTDNNLYAIDNQDGTAVWKTKIKTQTKPVLDGQYLIVGRERFDIATGKLID